MQAKTRALVLGTVKYGETSVIAQVYTEVFGWQSYLVNGVRSSKGKGGKAALLQPLTFLELDVNHASTRTLQRLNDAKLLHPYRSIPFEMKKTTVGLFLAEMLSKVLRESDGDERLFDFLLSSFTHFDNAQEGYENFHLHFLLGLSECMGFGFEDGNMLEEDLGSVLPNEVKEILLRLQAQEDVALTGKMRSALLDLLVKFYQHHLGGVGELRSLYVLQELWR